MTRKFIDLHLKSPEDAGSLEAMLRLAARLGFKGVGIVSDSTNDENPIQIASGIGLDPVSRVDIAPKTPRELTAALRRLRRRYEVVAVECNSKAVARQAAKDNRVDILDFPSSAASRRRVSFDRQEASLASQANCAYEINLVQILKLGPIAAGKFMSLMKDEVRNATRYDVPIIISSGAKDPLLLRGPRELAAVTDLLDIEEDRSLDAVSTTPWDMVARNREKLEPGFVAPGVREV